MRNGITRKYEIYYSDEQLSLNGNAIVEHFDRARAAEAWLTKPRRCTSDYIVRVRLDNAANGKRSTWIDGPIFAALTAANLMEDFLLLESGNVHEFRRAELERSIRAINNMVYSYT